MNNYKVSLTDRWICHIIAEVHDSVTGGEWGRGINKDVGLIELVPDTHSNHTNIFRFPDLSLVFCPLSLRLSKE